jgi:hypothetical protein
VIRWQDCDLEVKAEVVPRYCWTTVSIDVYLDDVCLLRTGGVLSIKGELTQTFERNSENHALKLSWRSAVLGMSFPYQLSIDGQSVIAGRVRPRNWPLLFLPVAAITLLIAFHFL